MTRHLLKLIWHRRRHNALLLLEMFLSFAVVFAVATAAVYFARNYRQPLGFSVGDVWTVQASSHADEVAGPTGESLATFDRLVREVRTLDPIVAAAELEVVPYSNSDEVSRQDVGGRTVRIDMNAAGEDLPRVMGLTLVAGRWFQAADEALAWEPVVINRELARLLYPHGDAVGQRYGKLDPKGEEREKRVVGVIADFRKSGELAGPGPYLFEPLRKKGHGVTNIMLKLRAGTPAAFEETLIRRLQALAPGWSFEVKPLAEMRDSSFRQRLVPLAIGGLIAFFLLFMAGLGLISVLWQNLLQRTREIGLRRATGASRAAVRRKIVAEQLLVATLALGVGALIAAQLPLLPFATFLSAGVLAGGALVAAATIYGLVFLCTLYPSGLASRVAPAEALRYE